MDSGHYGIDLGRTEEIQNCYQVDENSMRLNVTGDLRSIKYTKEWDIQEQTN